MQNAYKLHLGVRLLCSKIYLLCYAALLQITTYYAQQRPLLWLIEMINCAAQLLQKVEHSLGIKSQG